MHIPTQDELIGQVEDFCRRHDMSESRLGRDALNNPAFVSGLREGKSPTLETLNRLKSFMSETDERARLQAKLHPPVEPNADEEAAPPELPFAEAPATRAGATSPISSSTCARQPSAGASASSRCSTSGADA